MLSGYDLFYGEKDLFLMLVLRMIDRKEGYLRKENTHEPAHYGGTLCRTDHQIL